MSFSGARRAGFSPGIDDARLAVERTLTWGHWEVNCSYLIQRTIVSTSVAAGHTGFTNILSPGLAMFLVDGSPDKLRPWLVTDATVHCFLMESIDMEDSAGVVGDRFTGSLISGGQIKASGVQLAVETTRGLVGATNEAAFRALATVIDKFKFDDDQLTLP